MKKLTPGELQALAGEIRQELVRTVTANGGHLASNLGVVELTLALHRVFHSPQDKIIWDVGHQSYVHKLVTGRREQFPTLRRLGGLSGFTDPEESPHDSFSAGHASTSISAALGMALARDLAGEKHEVVAVIGDGALTGGMAFEALNHAGHLSKKLIVILNDNGMAISPNIGAVARLLNRVRTDPRYEEAKKKARRTVLHLPGGLRVWQWGKRVKNRFKRAVFPEAFWEELGFTYLGPVDGHNLEALDAALRWAKEPSNQPALLHVLTQKGRGYPPAEEDAVGYHGVPPASAPTRSLPSYSEVFAHALLELMKQDDRLVAITAAMLEGTSLKLVARDFPQRVLDVGICEQHAVTMAAGLATQGFIPVVAIYSTFLQRAYDQIVHDVCIQNLPVVFALDRAGIVGDDGRTHQGAFDLSYLSCIPNMTVAAPKDENELRHLLYTAIGCGHPMAIRFPRGSAQGLPREPFQPLPIGKGQLLREGEDVALVAVGAAVYPALEAAQALSQQGIQCTVVNARFVKPLDAELILSVARATGRVLTVEENAASGGLGSAVLRLLADFRVHVEVLGLPDRFIEHGTQRELRSLLGLDAAGIARRVKDAFPELSRALPLRS